MRVLAPDHLTDRVDAILIAEEHHVAGIDVDPVHVSPPHVTLVVDLEIVGQAIQKLGGLEDACEEVDGGHIRVVREGVGFEGRAVCDRQLRYDLLETTHEHVVFLHFRRILHDVYQESHFASEQLKCVKRRPHVITHSGCGLGGRGVNSLGNMVDRDALAVTGGKLIVQTQEATSTLLELVDEKREYLLL